MACCHDSCLTKDDQFMAPDFHLFMFVLKEFLEAGMTGGPTMESLVS